MFQDLLPSLLQNQSWFTQGGLIGLFRVDASQDWPLTTSPLTRYGKKIATFLSDKDKSWLSALLTLESSWQRHDIIIYFTCSRISWNWEFCSTIADGSLLLQYLPQCSRRLNKFYESVFEILWDDVFMVRNTVITGKSCFSAIIFRKWRAYEMQFRLIVVSIILNTCVKDHGESLSRLTERRIWLSRVEVLFPAFL